MIRVAFFSPFRPQKSGISDFCEELLPYLQDKLEIEIFTDTKLSNEKITSLFLIHPLSDFDKEEVRNRFQMFWYQIGNNHIFHEDIYRMFLKYPGVVELHDLSIHSFMAMITIDRGDVKGYRELMRYCHGAFGENLVERFQKGEIPCPFVTHAAELPMNKFLIDRANAVIVHSDYAKQYLKAIVPRKKIEVIPLHAELNKAETEKKSSNGKIVFASFGYVTATRRIESVLIALGRFYNETKVDFEYLVVGEIGEKSLSIEDTAKQNGISGKVKVLGYVSKEKYEECLSICDIAINLRYPFYGESSAALHRLLGAGKATIVTNIGSFMEYPDNVVKKVSFGANEVEDIVQALRCLASDEPLRKSYEKNAHQYAELYCDIRKNAERYAIALQDFLYETFRENDCYERLVDTLFEFYLTEDEYVNHVSHRCAVLT